MKIYAIRHGQTKLNTEGIINGGIDDELTEEGIKQAEAAALILPKTVNRMYVSTLGRAKQTATILNKDLRLPIIYSDDLREVDFGDLNGTPFTQESKDKHRDMTYDWSPSGESLTNVLARTLRILREVERDNDDGEALLVAHGGTIRALYYLENGGQMGKIGNAALFSYDLNAIFERASTI